MPLNEGFQVKYSIFLYSFWFSVELNRVVVLFLLFADLHD